MEVEEIKDSVTKWINEKFRNPYIASVITVWIGFNKKLLFAIFNFDSSFSTTRRIEYVDKFYDQFDWFVDGFGFYFVILYSLIGGYFFMIAMSLINYTGRWVYKKVNDFTSSKQASWEPTKWYKASEKESLIKKSTNLSKELDSINLSYDRAMNKISSLQDELDNKEKNTNNLKAKIKRLEESSEKVEVPEEVFGKGAWVNEYQIDKKRNGSEVFFVKGDNYILRNENDPTFIIDDFQQNGKLISFEKKAVKENDNRHTINYLIKLPDNSFEGWEFNVGQPKHVGNKVRYYQKSRVVMM
ncbi:hypothetical protein [Ekhidna sp.]|uniref:coiled-coil domain-containing protein n=1 Tax=Ekhidna sp. TaxID=2608089 RepID=UPI0032EAC505